MLYGQKLADPALTRIRLNIVSHIMAETDDLNSRVAHVRAYAKAMVAGMWIMDQRRHMLKPFVDDAEIREALARKFEGTYGAQAYNHMAPLLAQDLLRDLARLYLDRNRKTGSYTNVFRKASERNVHEALREYFRTMPDRQERHHEFGEGITPEEAAALEAEWLERDRVKYLKSFDEGWETVKKAAEELDSDPLTEKIKTFRDKNHAHLEMQPIGSDPGPVPVSELGIKISDIFAFADKYEPALLELTRVTTGGLYAVKNFHEMHERCGNEMWRILSGLPVKNG